MIILNKKNWIWTGLMLLLLALGLEFESLYNHSDIRQNKLSDFQNQLNSLQKSADNETSALYQYYLDNSVDSLFKLRFKSGNSYFLFRNKDLVYWNKNHFDIAKITQTTTDHWKFAFLPNLQCIYKWYIKDNQNNILAVIPVKKDFSFENQLLSNDFVYPFELNDDYIISSEKLEKGVQIHCDKGDFLFNIQSDKVEKNQLYRYLSMILYFVVFLMMIWVVHIKQPFTFYFKNATSGFGISAIISGSIVLLALSSNLPPTLLQNEIFPINRYATDGIFASVTHISLFSIYFWILTSLLYFRVKKNLPLSSQSAISLKVFFISISALVIYLVYSLIRHSTYSFNILKIKDLNGENLWIHFLFVVWGTCLYLIYLISFKKGIKSDKKLFIREIYWFIGIYTLVIISFSLYWNEHKKEEKIRVIAENMLLSGDFDNEFPGINAQSYSFPDLLKTGVSSVSDQLNLSAALYKNNQLEKHKGAFNWPQKMDLQPKLKSFDSFKLNDRKIYVQRSSDNQVLLITQNTEISTYIYALYVLYALIGFLMATALIYRSFLFIKDKKINLPGLTSRFQWAFFFLFIISFAGIFLVSVNFIQNKYREEQNKAINEKKNYIQKSLQELYYWNEDISSVDANGLSIELQELSHLYQTDINIYDNAGRLKASSQPLIFEKQLTSSRIASGPFFGNTPNINITENIGSLNYLAAYTELFNGDYLQIGYISIPQYLSEEEINREIAKFMSSIIHIYFFVLLIAVMVMLITGKRLATPLKMLEEKLSFMRLGDKNEKIEYRWDDEIGQLVEQYNRTVDELEKSAALLAQSERESAWRTMARQIAHEINNPLTPMKLTIQQLQRTKKLNDESFNQYFEKSTSTLIEQIDHLSNIATTFSNFARLPEAKMSPVDISAKLYNVYQLFKDNHEHIRVIFHGPESGLYIIADPEQLVQVFNNLLKNAFQSIPFDKKGKIDIYIKQMDKDVEISVQDNGTGITKEDQEKLFSPNFTTKTTGMGLGLSIVKNIIEITGGKISYTTRVGHGSTFTINFNLYN